MIRKLFPSQLESEKIILVVREHWFYLTLKLLVWVFFAAALVVFNLVVSDFLPLLFIGRFGQVTALFTQVYTLFLAVSLFLILLLHYLNIHIITNIRVVDIDQVGLFSHRVSELHIDKIEDVTSETNGIISSIFDYGNVYIQTAGTVEHFEFSNVPDPTSIEKLVLDLYEQQNP